MFQRQLDVSIINNNGEQLYLVDHELRENTLVCNGTINRYSYGKVDQARVTINNLSPAKIGDILSRKYLSGGILRIDFGYEDDALLSTLFIGNIQRGHLQRPDSVSTKFTIYALESGDFVNYGFFSKGYQDGYNVYAIVADIAKQNNITNISIDDELKRYHLKGSTSFCGRADNLLQQLAQQCGYKYTKTNGLISISRYGKIGSEEIIYFTTTGDDGKVYSASGLIGIPQLTETGLEFDCLINPKLNIGGLVFIDNSIINVAQAVGQFNIGEADIQLGATLSSNGLYRIISFNTRFANNDNESKCSVVAIAANIFDEYIANNNGVGKTVTYE